MSKPIFLIGCPRSGTTITLKIMAIHSDLAWVSNFLNKNPMSHRYNILNRIYDIPFIGEQLYLAKTERNRRFPIQMRRILPYPVEPWNFWNSYLSKFQWKRGGEIPPRRRIPEDITPIEIRNIRKAIHNILYYQGKRRFISKYTDFPRMKYLSQAFSDAFFIHIIRDGRAVSASYHKKIESNDFNTWNEREWWIRGWPSEWRKEWIENYKTPLAFVAFQWKFFVNEIIKDAKKISKEQYLEIKYRDIIDSPLTTFNQIFDFCELKRCRKVKWYLNKINLQDMNKKWKKRYIESKKNILEQIIHEQKFRKFNDD